MPENEIILIVNKLQKQYGFSNEEHDAIISKAIEFENERVLGHSFTEWAQASVYIAATSLLCKPMVFSDYCESIGAYRNIWKIIRKLRKKDEEKRGRLPCYIRPHIYIDKIVDHFKLSRRFKGSAYRLANEWEKKHHGHNINPRGDAGAIVWIISQIEQFREFRAKLVITPSGVVLEKMGQKQLAELLGICEVTIRDRKRLMERMLYEQ